MRRHIVAATAFVLLAVACGQYPGVHEQAVQSGEYLQPGLTGAPGTTGTGTTGTGTTGTGTTGTGTTTGGGGSTSGGGGTSTTTQGGPAAPGEGGGGTEAPIAGDTTGVTDSEIIIGIHAPLTGAAPLKASSFAEGKDLYWEKGNNGRPVEIYGRRVRVIFQDDHYNPSYARTVCQQMTEQDNAFLLIGGAGTDQIQACAQFAAQQGIPYLSGGVTEIGLRGLPNYFALSKSYPQQAYMLADYIRQKKREFGWSGGPERVAMVATNTANFDDVVAAFQDAMPGAAIFRPEKNEAGESMAANLCTGTQKNYDVVFPITAPRYYLEMAGAAKCNPQYAGIGISMGLDEVARLGCRVTGGAIEGARFFSPAPAFADTDKYDPVFRRAGGSDDIVWLFWGLSKDLHELLLEAGKSLSREAFIARSSEASVRTGVFPDLTYTPRDHFGAKQVHVLENICDGARTGHYETDVPFVSGF